MCIHGWRVASRGSHDGCGRHEELETHFCAHRTLSQHQTASIEIGRQGSGLITVPVNERRARVAGALISLKTDRIDDHSHLYPKAHGERMGRVDLLSHAWDENTMKDERLLNYMASMDTEMSDDSGMMVNGNRGWWLNITYVRTTKEGSKLLFDLIHTVTAERISLPENRIVSSRSSSMKSRTRLAASV